MLCNLIEFVAFAIIRMREKNHPRHCETQSAVAVQPPFASTPSSLRGAKRRGSPDFVKPTSRAVSSGLPRALRALAMTRVGAVNRRDKTARDDEAGELCADVVKSLAMTRVHDYKPVKRLHAR